MPTVWSRSLRPLAPEYQSPTSQGLPGQALDVGDLAEQLRVDRQLRRTPQLHGRRHGGRQAGPCLAGRTGWTLPGGPDRMDGRRRVATTAVAAPWRSDTAALMRRHGRVARGWR